jgi:hypothetical protein
VNRDALGPALVALLAIVALGIGASALDTRSTGGTAGSGGGSGGIGDGTVSGLGQLAPTDTNAGPAIPKIVLQLFVVALYIGLLVGLYLWRDNLREFGTIVAGMAIFVLTAAVVLLYGDFGSSGKSNSSGARGFFERPLSIPGGGSGQSSNEALTVTNDPLLLALAIAVALVIAVIVLVRFRNDDSTPESEPEAENAETMTELGRVAGRAADRIADDADPANEVYRAWHEMTDQLELSNPESSTPGEFARAATDAGMAREDVDELTDLFRIVRYGGSDPTAERESRAVSALQRIKDEYGGES